MSVLDPQASGLFKPLPPAGNLGDTSERIISIPGVIDRYVRGSLDSRLHTWCDRWIAIDTQSFSADKFYIARVPEAWGMMWFRIYEMDVLGFPRKADLLLIGAWSRAAIVPVFSTVRHEGIMIRPGGLRAVFGVPADEMANTRFTAEELWGIDGRILHQRLMSTNCSRTRFSLMADALHQQVRRHASVQACELAEAMCRVGRLLPVREIASLTGYSQRQLQRQFSDGVGMTPKRFETILRLRRVVAEVLRQPDPNWAKVALDHGFCDQAHFTNQWASVYSEPPERMHRAYRAHGNWLEGMLIMRKGPTS